MVHDAQMPTPPRKYPAIRVTIPVPLKAHAAFSDLAEVLGRSLGSVIGEWLLDQADAATSMAENIHHLKSTGKLFQEEVLAHVDLVQEATQAALKRAQERRGAVEGPRAAGGAAAAAKPRKAPLTPPSSNTGGKVSGKKEKTSRRPR